MPGGLREVVLNFKFRQNRLNHFRAVGGRNLPFPIPKASGLCNSLYYCTSRDISCRMIEQVASAATCAGQLAMASRNDAMANVLPSKIPRFEKPSSSCSISDDTLTKHLMTLWERQESPVPTTSAAPVTSSVTLPVSRTGSKRKATSVLSYLSASKPDVSLPSADASNQLSTTTILSQLLSSYSAAAASPADVSLVNSIGSYSPQLSQQKNILLMQKDAQNVAAAKQSSAVNRSSLPLRRSSTESATTNIFRLPTYEQVIGNRPTSSSPLIKAKTAASDVFLPSPQIGSSASAGNIVSSLVTDDVSSAGGASSLLLNRSTTDSASIASHIQLDDNELLRQLEQILSEPGLSLSDIDNVLGGCLAVAPSLPQSLSAIDQKAISVIQSQLMSMEASPSSPAAANSASAQWRNGTLCQMLSGKSLATSDTSLSTDRSEIRSRGSIPPVDHQPMSTAATTSGHVAFGQYYCVLCEQMYVNCCCCCGLFVKPPYFMFTKLLEEILIGWMLLVTFIAMKIKIKHACDKCV